MLILASASPRRLDLLAQIGVVPHQVIAANCDETPLKQEIPSQYVTRIAAAKAMTIRAQLTRDSNNFGAKSRLILAADTCVAVGRRILGQASDAAMAATHLSLLSGRRHRVYSAVCLLAVSPAGEILARHEKLVQSQVAFKRLDAEEIKTYLARDEWRGKAGSYAIQGRAAQFVRQINGSYSNIVGLPLFETAAWLRHYRMLP